MNKIEKAIETLLSNAGIRNVDLNIIEYTDFDHLKGQFLIKNEDNDGMIDVYSVAVRREGYSNSPETGNWEVWQQTPTKQKTFLKLDQDEKIPFGAFHSTDNGETLIPVQNMETIGDIPANFAEDRSFWVLENQL
jgi:hypothetical protein